MNAEWNSFRLPTKVRTTFRLAECTFWDVKFCPWYSLEDENEPIFAIVAKDYVLICQLVEKDEQEVSVLVVVRPESAHGPSELDTINSCTWCYVNEEQPLIAVGGDNGQVNVVQALSGKLYASLLGHSVGHVNDLGTHPIYPWIIASASMDASIRIWDLRRLSLKYESTCIIICGHGQAHKEGLLTMAWHSSGRYIISSGHDHRICIWTIPDLSDESVFWSSIAKESRARSSDDVHLIHYPHFISSAVHSDYVDKVVFVGDLVMSKAAEENKIVLWHATGFNSRMPPPGTNTAPKTLEHLDTRNGFVRKQDATANGNLSITIDDRYQDKPLYQRILEFKSPMCSSFYMRFGISQPSAQYPRIHQTLAIGNTNSKIRLWDLERLVAGHAGTLVESRTETDMTGKSAKVKKAFSSRIQKHGAKDRLSSVTQSIANNSVSASVSSRHNSPASSIRSSPFPAAADIDLGGSTSTNPPSLVSYFRHESTDATTPSFSQSNTEVQVQSSIEGSIGSIPDRTKYPLDNPFEPLKEHKLITIQEFGNVNVMARAAEWSPCGRWCIVVGEGGGGGFACILDRYR